MQYISMETTLTEGPTSVCMSCWYQQIYITTELHPIAFWTCEEKCWRCNRPTFVLLKYSPIGIFFFLSVPLYQPHRWPSFGPHCWHIPPHASVRDVFLQLFYCIMPSQLIRGVLHVFTNLNVHAHHHQWHLLQAVTVLLLTSLSFHSLSPRSWL